MKKTNTWQYSVILPTYKEIENLRVLIPQLLIMFEKTRRNGEIVVVDDASNDGTREFLTKLTKNGEPVKLIERVSERGVSSAMKKGTDAANYENIIHMDSDLAHDVVDLRKLLDFYEEKKGKGIVIGSRYVNKSVFKGKPLVNILASLIGQLLLRFFLRVPVKDSSNNFRVFSRNIWQKVRQSLTLEGNIMIAQELILMEKFGENFYELPITYMERRFGESKLKVWKETKKFFCALPTLFKNRYF